MLLTLSRTVVLAGLVGLGLSLAPVPAKAAGGAFASFPGRWTGQGRLGFKDGKIENVTCRATYFVAEDTGNLTQNIRCASASGKIEVKSNVAEKDGKLSGSWNELIYNMQGELSGQVTKYGFLVTVKGTGESTLDATMDLIVKNAKQVVEIHFNSSTLLGLTLMLDKSTSNLQTSERQD